MIFQKDDIVRVRKEHASSMTLWADQDLIVVNSDESWTRVSLGRYNRTDSFYTYRFEKVNTRVEGSTIRPEDIVQGDEILVTMEGYFVRTKQGVISNIVHVTDHGQDNWVFYVKGSHANIRMHSTNSDPEAILTLVKAAPEVDPVLKSLEEAKNDSILEYTPTGIQPVLVRKKGDHWTFYYPNGQLTKTQDKAAETIRPFFETLCWLR